LIKISYSLLNTFRNCRKLTELKYVKGLSAKWDKHALIMGTNVHAILEEYYTDPTKNVDNTLKKILPKVESIDDQIVIEEMLRSYDKRYRKTDEDIEILSLEKFFESPVIDTDTMENIPGVVITGKIDGIVKYKGDVFLLEHKTASKPDDNYINGLWANLQIILYTYFASKVFGYKCCGVLYNVLAKPEKREQPETNEAYEKRCEVARAKNKSGKTNLKRKDGEDEDVFRERVKKFYEEERSIVREPIYIPKDLMKSTVEEISELTKAYVAAIKRDKFYRNTDYCYKYGKCEYHAICSSGEDKSVIDKFYKSTRKPLEVLEIDPTLEAL
jgi:hypothetical protein